MPDETLLDTITQLERKSRISYVVGALDSCGRVYRNGSLAVATKDPAVHSALSAVVNGGGRSEAHRWILRSPKNVRLVLAMWARHSHNEARKLALLTLLADLPEDPA